MKLRPPPAPVPPRPQVLCEPQSVVEEIFMLKGEQAAALAAPPPPLARTTSR